MFSLPSPTHTLHGDPAMRERCGAGVGFPPTGAEYRVAGELSDSADSCVPRCTELERFERARYTVNTLIQYKESTSTEKWANHIQKLKKRR